MTWAERATDANQMRQSDLKGREREEREQKWTNCELTTRHTQWGGLSDLDIHIRSSLHTQTHRSIQTMAEDLF